MLTKKIFKKMFVTSSIVVIILLIYLMPGVIELNNNEIKTSVEYVNLESNFIYWLDNDGLLVESSISVIDDGILVNKIKNLIKNLSDASREVIPNGLNSVLPSNVELLDVNVDENIVNLNFSKELIDLKEKDLVRVIEAIAFTIMDLEEVNGVGFYVDGDSISDIVSSSIPSIITKDFGINKRYDIKTTDNILKYVVYYTKKIDDNTYYVPITKYVNSSKEKISVIIEDLSSNYIYQPNLISVVTEELELIDYQISTDEMMLNFNNSIFLNNNEIKEEVVYPFVSTIFNNFDVKTVVIMEKGEEILKKTTKSS